MLNWLDVVIICLGIVGLVKGLFDGIIRQVVALVAMVLGIYLSTGVARWVKGYLTQFDWVSEQLVYPVSYFLGFVLIVGVILLAGRILHHMVKVTPLGIFNHILGGFLGLLLMVFFMSFLFIVIERFDKTSLVLPIEVKVESHLYDDIRNFIPRALPGNVFGLKIDNVDNIVE